MQQVVCVRPRSGIGRFVTMRPSAGRAVGQEFRAPGAATSRQPLPSQYPVCSPTAAG
jgi:hypothetical protein